MSEMRFDAKLTMTGLCLLITDDPEAPTAAELLLLDTASESHHHRHEPYLAMHYECRGNTGEAQPLLPGFDEYVIGPDGSAITRVPLTKTEIHIKATPADGGTPRFGGTLAKVPDLGKLGVNSVTLPGRDGEIANVTSRISLPPGTFTTTGDVADEDGPVEWEGVGVIAESVHLEWRGLSKLEIDHGANSFELIPMDGSVVFSISNEPRTASEFLIDLANNTVTVPHFHMFGAITDHAPVLLRRGPLTPGVPICPCARFFWRHWPFLRRRT